MEIDSTAETGTVAMNVLLRTTLADASLANDDGSYKYPESHTERLREMLALPPTETGPICVDSRKNARKLA